MLNKSLFGKYSLWRVCAHSDKRGKHPSYPFNKLMEDLERNFPFMWLKCQQLKILPCLICHPWWLWVISKKRWIWHRPIRECTCSRRAGREQTARCDRFTVSGPKRTRCRHTSKIYSSAISSGPVWVFPTEPSELLPVVQPLLLGISLSRKASKEVWK